MFSSVIRTILCVRQAISRGLLKFCFEQPLNRALGESAAIPTEVEQRRRGDRLSESLVNRPEHDSHRQQLATHALLLPHDEYA
jgi:hypothetical protein